MKSERPVRIPHKRPARPRGASTVTKAVGLLSVLARHPKGLGLSELSRVAGLHHTTAHRLLWSLHEVGLVECGEDRLYRLGLKILDLARALLGTLELREIAKPVLAWLATTSEETAQLATLDRQEMVFLDRVDGPHPVTLRTRLGARAPVHCTSMGKAYLAFAPAPVVDAVLRAAPLTRYTENTFTDPDLFRAHLEHVRRQGYAIDNEEDRPSIRCVGAPVLDHRGQAVAAVSVAGPAFRLPTRRIRALASLVKEGARRISEALGHGGAPADPARRGAEPPARGAPRLARSRRAAGVPAEPRARAQLGGRR